MGNRQTGISLIELMVVIAIVGILGAIASAWYQNFVRESNRTDAQTALLAIANGQEKRFIANNGYVDTTASINTLVNVGTAVNQGVIYQSGGNFFSPEGHYRLQLVDDTNANTFQVDAIAVSPAQLADGGCTTISVNQTNQRTPARCW